jgi:hypothetical protein
MPGNSRVSALHAVLPGRFEKCPLLADTLTSLLLHMLT